jgi:hypothetical protein
MARSGWIALGESAIFQKRLYDLDWIVPSFDPLHVALSHSGSFIGAYRAKLWPDLNICTLG